MSFGQIARFWEAVFTFGRSKLVAGATVAHTQVGIIGQSVNMPYPDLSATLPVISHCWFNLVVCALLLILSLFMPARLMPVTYLSRAALMIQASSSVYFLLSPKLFIYTLPLYLMTLGMYMLFLVPIVLSLVFYIFDFPIWWKLMVTIAAIAFFILAIPMQYMLHAYIIHATSYLFLPILYFLFGMLLDVLMFINFYAIGMSRGRDQSSDLGRYA